MEIRQPHAVRDAVSDGRLTRVTLFNVLTATSLFLLLALDGFLSGPEDRRTPP